MNKIDRITVLFLIYGFFAVFCQLIFMLLRFLTERSHAPLPILCDTYALWLEYPLVSVILLLGGAMLFRYLSGDGDKRR